jgi:hypothetical protein
VIAWAAAVLVESSLRFDDRSLGSEADEPGMQRKRFGDTSGGAARSPCTRQLVCAPSGLLMDRGCRRRERVPVRQRSDLVAGSVRDDHRPIIAPAGSPRNRA